MKLSDLDAKDYQEKKPTSLKLSDLERGSYQIHPPLAPSSDQPSKLESGLRGLAEGASLGAAPAIAGGIEYLRTGKPYKQARNESREAFHKAQNAHPFIYGAGTVGGSLPYAAITGDPLVAAPILGAIQGYAGSESENEEQNIKDAALGAALGLGVGAIGEGLGTLARSAKGGLKDIASRRAAAALGAERGTIKKIGSENIKDAGWNALEHKVVTPLANTEDMIARNESLRRQAGQQMGDIYNQVDSTGNKYFNPQNVALDVDKKIGDFYRSPINKGETSQLNNTLEAIRQRGDSGNKLAGKLGEEINLEGNENISLAEAQKLKEEVGKTAKWNNANQPTDKELMAREAYHIINKAIDDAANRGSTDIGVPGLKESLGKAKGIYGNTEDAAKLLKNREAKELGNKMGFGLTNTIAGTGAATAAYMTGHNPLTSAIVGGGVGLAKMGAERYGNQLTANLARAAYYAPEKIGIYAPILKNAARQGAQQLAISHYLLMKNDPEYRNLMDNLEE
jgi:hypothetical protein